MPHIAIDSPLPGIQGLFATRPDTARPLRELAQQLLRGASSLSATEREIIAASVSAWNECNFCSLSHGAAALALGPVEASTLDAIVRDLDSAPLSSKLKALLAVAHHVQRGGKQVTPALIEEARKQGASDADLHDTVLVAAAFCMFNRYVDGLATLAPTRREDYVGVGKMLAEQGYVRAE